MSDPKAIPFRARLHWYRLTPAEFCLLTAMLEHSSDGLTIWPSIRRLAAYSKLSMKQIYNLIHGYTSTATGEHVPGLLDRAIISEIAPANTAKRRPATYRVNEGAMVVDPAIIPYLSKERQETLPGIRLAAVPGERVHPQGTNAAGRPPAIIAVVPAEGGKKTSKSDTLACTPTATIAEVDPPDLWQSLQESLATIATNSRFDSRQTKPDSRRTSASPSARGALWGLTPEKSEEAITCAHELGRFRYMGLGDSRTTEQNRRKLSGLLGTANADVIEAFVTAVANGEIRYVKGMIRSDISKANNRSDLY
jgi:hypothetical protein